MKIYFIPPSMKDQKIEEDNVTEEKCFLDLQEKYLVYSQAYQVEVPKDADDLALGTNLEYICSRAKVFRNKIVGTEVSWSDYNKKWCVTVMAPGLNINLVYKRQNDAYETYDRIAHWLFEGMVETEHEGVEVELTTAP